MRILITGGSGCIGTAIKHTLTDHDVISPTSSELNLSKEIKTSYSNIDVLIHCAGINEIKKYNNINKTDFDNLFKINTYSFIELCKQLDFNKNANIIAIGSLYSTSTKELRGQYTMSKHALLGAVKTLALELSYKNIKVNMISPGFVNTSLTRKNNTQERINFLNDNIPLGLTTVDDMSSVVNFFALHNNAITGQNIIVDGGYSLKGL